MRKIIALFLTISSILFSASISYAELEKMSNSELRDVTAKFDISKDKKDILEGNDLYEAADDLHKNHDYLVYDNVINKLEKESHDFDVYQDSDGNIHIGGEFMEIALIAFIKTLNEEGFFKTAHSTVKSTEAYLEELNKED